MAIIALNSPEKFSLTSLLLASISMMSPVKEKSNFPPAAPKTI